MDKNRFEEAMALAEEILRDMELGQLPLAQVCLKTARLSRLLNDTDKTAVATDAAGHVAELEGRIETSRLRLAAAQDRPVSISSANPSQYVMTPSGNVVERNQIENAIIHHRQMLQKVRGDFYGYVLTIYYELRFSGVPTQIFEQTRLRADAALANMVPDAVKKFVSVFDNLKSKNEEDWANAVHSCRRILVAVADSLYPPNPGGVDEVTSASGKKIKVGPDHYVNRLMLYVEDRAESARFKDVVGAQLDYLGNRLDALSSAASKGTHTAIVRVDEAERYIIYTYLLIGDLLSLQG
jgi:hypothetical protein